MIIQKKPNTGPLQAISFPLQALFAVSVPWVLWLTGVVNAQNPEAIYPEVISQLAWKLKATSSTNPAFKKIGDYAFDGQPGTLWESKSELSATLDIDLGHHYDIEGFTFLPRQEGPWGRIKDYEFFVSRDGSSWGTPVSAGRLFRDKALRKISFPKSQAGRYVRLKGLSNYSGTGISVAELNILGTLNHLNANPVITVTSPTRYFPGVHVYEPADFSIRTMASLKNNQGPVQVTFYDKNKLLGTDDTAPFSWKIAAASAHVYQITAKAKYADQTEVTSLPVDFEIRSAANGIPIDRKNWQLQFVDSWKEKTDVGRSPGEKSFDDNPFTWWVTEWEPPHTVNYPHVIEIDMGKSHNIGGFLALPPQDPGTWGTMKDYEFYTSTEGSQWGTAVAKGTLVYPGDYMQKEQEVTFLFVNARYIKLKILSGYNAENQVLRVAEIYVLGKSNRD